MTFTFAGLSEDKTEVTLASLPGARSTNAEKTAHEQRVSWNLQTLKSVDTSADKLIKPCQIVLMV